MTDQERMDKEIEETVKEMKKKIDNITKESEGSNNDEISAVKDKAVEILGKVQEKLVSSCKEIKDSEEFNKVVTFVKTKSAELYDAAIAKIKEIKANDSLKENVTRAGSFVKDKADSIKSNEDLKKTVDNVAQKASEAFETVKNTVEEFVEKNDLDDKFSKALDITKDVAEKAIDITGDVAEKAIAALKDWLRPDEKEEKEDQNETKGDK